MKIKIRNMELGKIPRVVGIVDTLISMEQLQKYADCGVDIFEMRVDLFNAKFAHDIFEDMVSEYFKAFRKALSNPILCTIRENDFNRDHRHDWYVSLAKHTDIVDLELGMPDWRKVVDGIGGASVIMVSEHDFAGTPDTQGLRDIVKRSLDQGAQIVKIAVTANSASDVTRLLRFTEDCDTPLVAMAMGDMGKISRVAAPLFGSLFTYGYLRRAVVPGQPAAVELAKTFGELYP